MPLVFLSFSLSQRASYLYWWFVSTFHLVTFSFPYVFFLTLDKFMGGVSQTSEWWRERSSFGFAPSSIIGWMNTHICIYKLPVCLSLMMNLFPPPWLPTANKQTHNAGLPFWPPAALLCFVFRRHSFAPFHRYFFPLCFLHRQFSSMSFRVTMQSPASPLKICKNKS